jgi:hypothetical protein
MLDGKTPINHELRAKRKLPSLPGDFNFSLVAQVELDTIYKVNDRVVVTRLRDDLITNVIPACKLECNDSEQKARRRITRECPPRELAVAKEILKKQILIKAASRAHNFSRSQHGGGSTRKRSSTEAGWDQSRRNPPL